MVRTATQHSQQDYAADERPPAETWAPRSPDGPAGDRYAERPPASARDVDMADARERRDDADIDRRQSRDDRDGPRDGPGRFGDAQGGGGGRGFERRGPPPRPRNAPPAEPTNVVGVFGLSIRTRERDLEDEFNRYGEVEKVVIVYDQRTDRSRGFGFITMRTVEDATACIEKLNGIELHGRNIRVDYSATTKAHAPTPGEYRGERRPVDDRFAAGRRWDDRPPRGGDRGGDRWGGRHDDRGDRRDFGRRDYGDRDGRDSRDGRDGRDGRDWRDRDRREPAYGGPRRDDDPYGGRSRREDRDGRDGRDRDGGRDRERGFDRRSPSPNRRRSPSPARRRYSASPDRRPAPADAPAEQERF